MTLKPLNTASSTAKAKQEVVPATGVEFTPSSPPFKAAPEAGASDCVANLSEKGARWIVQSGSPGYCPTHG